MKEEFKISCEILMPLHKKGVFSYYHKCLYGWIGQNMGLIDNIGVYFLWRSEFPGRNSVSLPYYVAPCQYNAQIRVLSSENASVEKSNVLVT